MACMARRGVLGFAPEHQPFGASRTDDPELSRLQDALCGARQRGRSVRPAGALRFVPAQLAPAAAFAAGRARLDGPAGRDRRAGSTAAPAARARARSSGGVNARSRADGRG